ncbi:hypothetical protein PRK78_007308 [Emydomyces testavorans]|uniref:GPI anchored serine-threonine rich protein n=1 Tax=Emydomyces testavorans TaxID=2070801 RepID=A0AAF0IML7_9EURO|nr:hypothetical protein PRK78_007308 [Emydomyces testavorans]
MFFKASVILVGTLAVASQALEAASHDSNGVLDILKRQTTVCKPVPPPVTCERSCGAGYIQCVYETMCYNPGAGESCCSNGSKSLLVMVHTFSSSPPNMTKTEYCPKGTYCTDGGCCPNGKTLEECGATHSLSVIPPGQSQSSTQGSSSTSGGSPQSQTTTPQTTSTAKSSSSVVPTGTGKPGSPGSPGSPGTNATVTNPSPPRQTVNAASKVQGAAMALGLGAVGLLVALI